MWEGVTAVRDLLGVTIADGVSPLDAVLLLELEELSTPSDLESEEEAAEVPLAVEVAVEVLAEDGDVVCEANTASPAVTYKTCRVNFICVKQLFSFWLLKKKKGGIDHGFRLLRV